MRTMLKSKIHRARVTGCNVDYEGSVTVDKLLLEAADILPFERVEVLDINNGTRLSTYAIEGEAGSGEICLNGAAARLVAKDDIVIILTYNLVKEEAATEIKPIVVHVDSTNKIVDIKNQKDDKDWTKEFISTLGIEG
jgi:aspartate 1-decarboxylase